VHPRNGRNRTIADELCSLYVNRVLPRALRRPFVTRLFNSERDTSRRANKSRVIDETDERARGGKKIRINAMQIAGGVQGVRRRKV
jgi:hypothetical protein